MVEGALSSRSSRRRNHPLPVRAGTMSIQSRTRPVAHAVWATKDRGGVLCEGRDPWLLATLGRVALSHGGGGVMLLRPSSTTFFARGTATRREFSTPRGSCRRGRHRRDLDRRAARRRRAFACQRCGATPRPSVLQCVAPTGEITGASTGPCGDPLEFEVRADPTHPTIEGCQLERNQRP